MSTRKLRVGIIGVGFRAAIGLVPAFRETGRAEIVAAARRDAGRLAMVQKELQIDQGYADWREMLDQASLDAVVISTPYDLHPTLTLAALERGLHVFVEKPMALTSKDAQTMVRAVERAQRVLMVDYRTRAMRSWRKVKQVVEVGTIGPLRQVNITCALDARILRQPVALAADIRNWMNSSRMVKVLVNDAVQPGAWRRDPEKTGGGMFVDVGTHLVDLVFWLTGSPAVEVAAQRQLPDNGQASVVNCQATLANGTSVSLTFNDHVNGGDFRFYGHGRLTLFGDDGLLTADWSGYPPEEAQEIWVEQEGTRKQVEPMPEANTMASAFVATVLDGVPNIAPAAEAAQAVAFTEASLRAAAENALSRLDNKRRTHNVYSEKASAPSLF